MSEPLWRPIPDWPGYEAGDHGQVRSLKRRRPVVLATSVTSKGGHVTLHLCKEGRAFHTGVHRLVLLAFVGPCPEGMECRHLDGDPTNNRLSNLAWGTPKENGEDKVRHGRHHLGSRTHCKHGHEFTEENTATTPGHGRRCRTCHRERHRAYRASGKPA